MTARASEEPQAIQPLLASEECFFVFGERTAQPSTFHLCDLASIHAWRSGRSGTDRTRPTPLSLFLNGRSLADSSGIAYHLAEHGVILTPPAVRNIGIEGRLVRDGFRKALVHRRSVIEDLVKRLGNTGNQAEIIKAFTR